MLRAFLGGWLLLYDRNILKSCWKFQKIYVYPIQFLWGLIGLLFSLSTELQAYGVNTITLRNRLFCSLSVLSSRILIDTERLRKPEYEPDWFLYSYWQLCFDISYLILSWRFSPSAFFWVFHVRILLYYPHQNPDMWHGRRPLVHISHSSPVCCYWSGLLSSSACWNSQSLSHTLDWLSLIFQARFPWLASLMW